MKILVVDDDPQVRDFLCFGLREAGFEVIPAGDGTEALVQVAKDKPDVILMDLDMQPMGGQEALRRLKGDPVRSVIPVVILSGDATPDAVRRSAASGAADFIVKSDLRLESLARRLRKAAAAAGKSRESGANAIDEEGRGPG